jgi:hypothetical protein
MWSEFGFDCRGCPEPKKTMHSSPVREVDFSDTECGRRQASCKV